MARRDSYIMKKFKFAKKATKKSAKKTNTVIYDSLQEKLENEIEELELELEEAEVEMMNAEEEYSEKCEVYEDLNAQLEGLREELEDLDEESEYEEEDFDVTLNISLNAAQAREVHENFGGDVAEWLHSETELATALKNLDDWWLH
jgi:chromosome segregation ATPase